jgi:hypothetical protein
LLFLALLCAAFQAPHLQVWFIDWAPFVCRAYTFATPPVLTLDLADKYEDLVYSCVLHDGMFGRIYATPAFY